MKLSKTKEIRQCRVIELRNMTVRDLENGKNRDDIIAHLKARCVQIGVSKLTAISYIDEVFETLTRKMTNNV